MRKIHLMLTGSALALTLVACGGSPTTPDQAVGAGKPPVMATATLATAATPAGWVEADLRLAANKLPLVVKAPAGYTLNKGTMGTGVEVASEKLTFVVDDVTDSGEDYAARTKKDVKENSGMVFEKFALEQPEGFIAQMGAGNFIPCRFVTVGGRKYQFSVIPLNALTSEEDARQFYELAGLARAK